jgi:hypothetical protein
MMIHSENTTHHPANRDLSETGEGNEIPRRLRLSSREIAVAVALTVAALIQLCWSLTKPDDKLTSAGPDPAAITRHAR